MTKTKKKEKEPRKNKVAVRKVGAPRTVSLPEEDMVALGQEMVDWVIKNEPLHLAQWWAVEKMITEKQWDTYQQKEEFIPFYRKALTLIGLKYLSKESPIDPNLKNRWQRVYFKDLKKEEDETAKYHADLKKEEQKDISPELLALGKRFCQELEEHRNSIKKA